MTVTFYFAPTQQQYHELAAIVVARQGYGLDALSTLFFLFGLASVVVGLVFYALGALNLGRNMYFFPSHVLVGCSKCKALLLNCR
jgi:sulfate permease, SulP family